MTRPPVAILLGVLFFNSPAWAGPLSVGIKGGLTLATMGQNQEYQDLVDFQTRTGLTGGAFVAYPLSESFSLQGEVLYVSRGASLGESDARGPSGEDYGSFETFLKRDDLDVGVRARLGFAQGAKFRPYLLLGPAVSFELEEKVTNDPEPPFPVGTFPDILKSTGVGISLGLGSEIPLASGHWLVEANYDLGITDLAEDVVNGSLHASTWRFMTGYHF